jgi:hypothetical protein
VLLTDSFALPTIDLEEQAVTDQGELVRSLKESGLTNQVTFSSRVNSS